VKPYGYSLPGASLVMNLGKRSTCGPLERTAGFIAHKLPELKNPDRVGQLTEWPAAAMPGCLKFHFPAGEHCRDLQAATERFNSRIGRLLAC